MDANDKIELTVGQAVAIGRVVSNDRAGTPDYVTGFNDGIASFLSHAVAGRISFGRWRDAMKPGGAEARILSEVLAESPERSALGVEKPGGRSPFDLVE